MRITVNDERWGGAPQTRRRLNVPVVFRRLCGIAPSLNHPASRARGPTPPATRTRAFMCASRVSPACVRRPRRVSLCLSNGPPMSLYGPTSPTRHMPGRHPSTEPRGQKHDLTTRFAPPSPVTVAVGHFSPSGCHVRDGRSARETGHPAGAWISVRRATPQATRVPRRSARRAKQEYALRHGESGCDRKLMYWSRSTKS
jgi:hypothetical protein